MADRVCTEDGCGSPHVAKGLCNAHYKRRRYHDPTSGVRAQTLATMGRYYKEKSSDPEWYTTVLERNRTYDRTPEGRAAKYLRNQRRRAKLRNCVVEPYSTEDLHWLLEEVHDWRCAYCYAPVVDLHWDHILAIGNNGADAIWNLAPSCAFCNLSKGPRFLEVWLPRHLKRIDLWIAARASTPAPLPTGEDTTSASSLAAPKESTP